MREGYKKTEVGVIPEDWNLKAMDDVAFINPESLNNSTNKALSINYIDIESVKTGKILGSKNYTFGEAPSRARRIVKVDDVIVSTVRPNLKSIAAIKENIENLVCSTGFAVLRNKNDLCSKFLYQYSLSDIFTEQLVNKTVGSNYPAVNTSDIKTTYIIVPPLEEQEKIAEILSTVDYQIDDTEKLIEKSKELKKGLMQKLLTKGIGHSEFKKTEVGEIPAEWEVKEVSQCGVIMGGNAFKSSKFRTQCDNEEFYQVIRMGNVQQDKLDIDKNPVYLLKSDLIDKDKKYILNKHDVLISLTGTVNKTDYGNVAEVKYNDKYLLNQRVACIRSMSNKCINKYLYYIMKSSKFRKQFFELGVGGTGNQANVSINDLSLIKIPVPSISEQEKICQILSKVDNSIEEFINNKQNLEQVKKGLMQQLLVGKVRVV